MRCFLSVLLLTISPVLSGQVFTDVSEELGVQHTYVDGLYGGGVSFYDADKDGWDDITFCSNSIGIVLYRNTEGVFDDGIILIQSTDEFKSAHWVDYDNDGDADLFVTRYLSNWSLYQNNGSIYELEDVTEEANLPAFTFYETMGHSWGDIDRDGDLDLYICNYNLDDATNFLFLNNGDGTFSDVTEENGAGDGHKPSFQSIFVDLNHSRKLALFVINDRMPHANSYYKIDPSGLTDITAFTGMEIYMCSMNTSIADYDHDGDFDMYITNTTGGNHLLDNDIENSHFTNVAQAAGVAIFERSWSALWVDYDNNGWEDLHVCKNSFLGSSSQNKLFQNNQDATFTDVTNPDFLPDAPNTASYSSAKGDFNQDGYIDIVVLNQNPHNAELLQNSGGTNNYVTVNLQGVFSNSDAIGSRIDVWANGEQYMRFTHCGEGYLTQNSATNIIGIGTAESIDSIRIEWPNGLTEFLYDISANDRLFIVEGQLTDELTSSYAQMQYSDTSLCGLDSLLLIANVPDDITWNTGLQNDSLWVTSTGAYWYTFLFNQEVFYSDTLNVFSNEIFDATITTSPSLCYTDETGSIGYELNDEDELSYYTVNGELDASLTSLQAGTYELILVNEVGCMYWDTVTIASAPELITEFEVSQALCFDELSTVNLTIAGGTPSYITYWEGFNPNDAIPGTFFPYVTDANGCTSGSMVTIEPVTQVSVDLSALPSLNGNDGSITLGIEGGTGDYTFQWSGSDGFTSNDQNLSDLAPGFYTLIAQDSNGCIVSDSILVTAVTVVELVNFDGVIYPQPADDYVVIESTSPIQKTDIYDLQGRLIETFFNSSSELRTKLNIAHLFAGPYLLLLHHEQGLSRTILIVK
ncbi:MAG: hypothetical protein ACJAYM_001784 [Flavobacteriales bacterium]|jgi:hypothetical protein